MEPLNDLIWTDETEGEEDEGLFVSPDGTRMVQICEVSLHSCSGDGGAHDPFTAGNFGADGVCGC